ncbi:ComEC/Rec2 family competence protein [Mycoplasmoides alvi]|uniref:ComEC/Rec2 family competence protein n=1 Tax=Mycoplasmoides alvi TaxID=78580 RepID=UPI00051B1D7F|nr:ComEC/Rec2 family competence protein [Mycoplasmoides alvi]
MLLNSIHAINKEKFIFLLFLFLSGLVYLTFSKNFELLICFIIIFITLLLITNWKIIYWVVIIGILILIWGQILYYLGGQKWEIKTIFSFIPSEYNLRNLLIEQIKNNKSEIKNLILLIVFNEKSNLVENFYNDLCNLGIAHLFVVSGFHLNLIYSFINRIFKKYPIFSKSLGFIVILFYGYLLNFSYGAMRVMILIFLDLIFKKTKSWNLQSKTGLSGFILLVLNPYCVFNLSFQLTFLSLLGICLTNFISINKYLKPFISSFLINLLIGPIILKINGKISIFTILNSWLFSPFIFFYYIFTLFIFWFPFLWSWIDFMYNGLFIINLLSKVNLFIHLDIYIINKWFFYFYYFMFVSVFIFLNSSKKNLS